MENYSIQKIRLLTTRLLMTCAWLVIGVFQFAWGQVPDGTYKVINRYSGQSLGCHNGNTANGTKLKQWPYAGATDAQWTLTSLGNGQYKLINVKSGRAANVASNSTADGAAIQIWDYNTADEDNFTLVDMGDGYYTPVFVKSGFAMQVSKDTSLNQCGALAWAQPVVQSTYGSTTKNAQWRFVVPSDGSTAGDPFSMCALPDTQEETSSTYGSTPQMFYNQTAWINDQCISRNIQYVMHLGDIVDRGTNLDQWTIARTALYALDKTVPYGTAVGNHDFNYVTDGTTGVTTWWTTTYEQSFGVSHFQNKSYYGGYLPGFGNANHYDLISTSGLDFIIVYIRWCDPGVPQLYENIAWADDVLKAYPNRRAILVSHELINIDGNWSGNGQAIYDGVKTNANLFLMMCGHVAPCKEAVRADTYNGHTVYTMLADYQDGDAPDYGGYGILRYLQFIPKENMITSQTYCVATGSTMYSCSIPYQMHGEPAGLATNPAVYAIVNKTSALAMDLKSASTAEGAVVDQETYAANSEQQWMLVPSENMDHFKIVSKVSGKALGIVGNSTVLGDPVACSTYIKNNPGQQWDLADAGGGWFYIYNVNSGLVLDDKGNGTTSGTPIVQWTGKASSNQKWRLQPIGIYYIQTSSGNYLSTLASGGSNGTPVVQYTGTNGLFFHWQFLGVGEGRLEVASRNNTCLSVAGGGTASGGSTAVGANCNIYTYSSTNPSGQEVTIKPLTNGRVKFYFTHSGFSWDMPGEGLGLNLTLQQDVDVPNTPQQEFLLQRMP